MILNGKSFQSVAEVTIYPFLNDLLQSEDGTVVNETLNYIHIFADIGVKRKYFLGLQNLLYHKNSNVARRSFEILRKLSPDVGGKEVEVSTDIWKSMYPFFCDQSVSAPSVAIESLKIIDVMVDYGIVGDYRILQKALLHKNNNVAHLAFGILRKIRGLCTEPRIEEVKTPEKNNEYEKVKTKYVAIRKLTNDSKSKREVLEGVTNRLQKIKDIDAKINVLEDELKELPGYEKVSNEIISDLRSLEHQRNELQDEVDKTRAEYINEQDALNNAKPEKSNNLLYIGIVIFLIGVSGTLLINSLFIICILIGIILIIYTIKSKTDNVVARRARIEQFESAIHEKETSIENISRQIDSYYSSLPTNNLKELSENFEIYSEKAQRKADLVSQKDIMMGKTKADELEKRRHELSIEIGKNETKIKELGEQNLSAEEKIKLQGLSV